MNLRNIFLYSVVVLVSSCASIGTENNLAGIYKVTSKKCIGSQYQKDACNEIKLLEIVLGSFYKIRDHEYAFVIWSGNTDLNYNARKLDENLEKISFPFELVIDSDGTYLERLVFESRVEGKYESGKSNSLSTLTFKKAIPEDIAGFRKEYPGND